jgi:folate-binding Fe-S cluster repair protein YgfZ
VIGVSNAYILYLRITLIRVAQETSTHDEGVPDDYLLHRIVHGVPEGVNDISPMQAFPMESNMDVMGGCKFFYLHNAWRAYAMT